jgi:hypothetical protein
MKAAKLLLALLSIVAGSRAVLAEPIDFVRDVRPIFTKHCYECHGEKKQKSGLRLDIKAAAFKGGEGYGTLIADKDPASSTLIQLVSSKTESERMPPKGEGLSPDEIAVLERWIAEGAAWPDGVDTAKLHDPRDHWSFKPLSIAPGTHSIDSFIAAKLKERGLAMSPETDRATWLRRVSFDLVGLPPTPEQVAVFVADSRSDAYERVVDELLDSPRYGERWGQHWLDVVRYADTHGFEVNTERPHAWPYRDYVIEAFNRDTPYDQFVREQLAGDMLGKETATGFLITASVLLPGQIGADEPSKRLARQDSLDDIVINIGQTFLGLSIGCARCHDHKFDPISQRDYYSMQAFVAGVEYADRPVNTPEALANKLKELSLQKRIDQIEQELSLLEPVAQIAAATTKPTSPERNEEEFSPREAKFVRFTIHNANLHPSLGLIEPCIDEFEIFTSDSPTRNVALASLGTKVTASGSRTSNIHRLEHIHDGQYGNSHSWMSDEAGRGWVMFELPEAASIQKIVWGRDRLGQFTDRLPIAYTIEAGLSESDLTPVVTKASTRSSINARKNVDRIAPTTAKRLRFTINATNNLEPCVDELEVFTTDGTNIALASAGAMVTSSGDSVSPDRHELQFLNDGNYGNSRSWMSSETGKGWVILEFKDESTIERIVWGRDRQGEYGDRLATDYRIEVAASGDDWKEVASSADRDAYKADGNNRPSNFSTAGLLPHEVIKSNRLQAERKSLESQLTTAREGQLAFAGNFRKPDDIRLLYRGDPEQPKEQVVAAVPAALETLALAADADEPQRRIALADWITRPSNTLTARVMANRIWQGHFGTGLVDTPSDFGNTGGKPSHPELLDWLAQAFVDSGWSVKQMHRLMVLSATYRQSTQHNEAAAAIDVDVRLLWRYPPRRLEAEAIRDTMLAVSGKLNFKMGGRGFDLFDLRGGLSGFKPVESFQGDGLRRMIYAHKVRREREAVFGAFDCPDAGQSTARRRESTTPIQALNLFNSRFTLEQSEAFAERVKTESGDDLPKQIIRAYQIAFSRDPSPDEIAECEPLVRDYGLATLCRVLFNSNEFLFVP